MHYSSNLYRSYYPHWSKELVSPVCRIFNCTLPLGAPVSDSVYPDTPMKVVFWKPYTEAYKANTYFRHLSLMKQPYQVRSRILLCH